MVASKVNLVQGGFNISVENVDPILKAIKAVAPDLDKGLKKKLREIGSEIVRGAKTRVPDESPMSNWSREPTGTDPNWRVKWHADERGLRQRDGGFPRYNAGQIRAGIKTGTGKPKGAKYGGLLYVQNSDAAGSIFEVSGRKGVGRDRTGGQHFIDTLNDIDSASRVIWDTFDDLGRTKIQERVLEAVNEAEEELQRRLGGEGFVETRR